MKTFLPVINDWVNNKKKFAIATVISTWGSAPRPAGAVLIINEDMEMAGSVSGGCVEGAVIKAAQPLIKNRQARLLNFGVTDEDAWEVGLSCGGKINVFVEPFMGNDVRPAERRIWEKLYECLSNDQPCVLLTRLQEGEPLHFLVLSDGSALGQQLSEEVVSAGVKAYRERNNQVVKIGEQEYFARVFPRQPRLLIIGAAHITVDLVELAKFFGFETIVIDPRGIFANKTQFSTPPDQMHETYPSEVLPNFTLDAYTYAVILSHDPKIDDNALHLLLRSEVGYIGVLGGRKTRQKRVARLQKAGFTEAEIGRIHAPIGIDINAKTPREIALSIMAELIKTQNAYR